VSARGVLGLSLLAQCALLACVPPYGKISPVGVDVTCRGLPPSGFDDGPSPSEVGLLWLRPDGSRDRQLGSAWCETVGNPVYVASPDRGLETTPSDSLLVVSWNMNVGGGNLGSLLATELGLSCAASAPGQGSRGMQPFVLLVQEAYRRSAELPIAPANSLIPPTIDPRTASAEDLDIVELARACGLSVIYVPSMRNGPDSGTRPHEDKGNAVLSNLPLSSPVAIDLPFETYRRVAVGAEVDVGGRLLRVVSVHFDVTALPYRLLLTGNQTRARQAAGLIEALDVLNSEGFAEAGTLVGGDMNSWSSKETAVRLMRRAFPDSPPDDGLTTRGIFPTDHVFFRSDAGYLRPSELRVLERSYGSDHRGRALLLTREDGERHVQ
jgi:endonuclease/exonuclease/phosphatase family metal-dependent hydrolase